MNPLNDPAAENGGLWAFSLAFYEQAGVAAALIALQDEAGLNVNLMLFAIWLGLSGRGRIGPPAIDRAQQAVRSLEVEVIAPLRALRRRLRTASPADIQRLREGIKAVEIEAEKATQARLAALAGPVIKADPAGCLADAQANLSLYLGAGPASGAPTAIIRRELQRIGRSPSPALGFPRSSPASA